MCRSAPITYASPSVALAGKSLIASRLPLTTNDVPSTPSSPILIAEPHSLLAIVSEPSPVSIAVDQRCHNILSVASLTGSVLDQPLASVKLTSLVLKVYVEGPVG